MGLHAVLRQPLVDDAATFVALADMELPGGGAQPLIDDAPAIVELADMAAIVEPAHMELPGGGAVSLAHCLDAAGHERWELRARVPVPMTKGETVELDPIDLHKLLTATGYIIKHPVKTSP